MDGKVSSCNMICFVVQGPPAAQAPQNEASQAQPEPVKVPHEPMVREVTSGLSLPEEVDELMREHLRFLYREGVNIAIYFQQCACQMVPAALAKLSAAPCWLTDLCS